MIYSIYERQLENFRSENSSCIHYKSEKLQKLMKIFKHMHRPKSRGVLSQTQEIGPILGKLTQVVLPHYLCDQKVTRRGNVSQIPPPCDVTSRLSQELPRYHCDQKDTRRRNASLLVAVFFRTGTKKHSHRTRDLLCVVKCEVMSLQ